MSCRPATARAGEAALIEAARGGDRSAFSALYADHRPAVLARLTRLLGADAAVDDVAQDTFLRAYRGLASFRADAPFRHWLLRIATHAARAEQRSLRRLIFRLFAGDEEERMASERSAQGPLRYPELATVHQALLRLPPSQREAVVAFELEGRSLAEIAGALEVPLHTVAARVRRGREQLRAHLGTMGWVIASVLALLVVVSGARAWIAKRRVPAPVPAAAPVLPAPPSAPRTQALPTVVTPPARPSPRKQRAQARKAPARTEQLQLESDEPFGDVIYGKPLVQQPPLFTTKEYKARGVLVTE